MPESCDQAVTDALAHLEAALGLLDGSDAPAHIGAHVDLAICQLCEAFGLERDRPATVPAGRNLPTD
jgi:hypothetical protein